MKKTVALFDFDGVVVDTESQYSLFWHRMGQDYLGRDDLETVIKGQTLNFIYQTYFPSMEKVQEEITARLNVYEQEMRYDYVAGFLPFYEELKRHSVQTAIVTSSNHLKMEAAYACHAELRTMFDRIFTAEMFTRSKPAPDCYLLGMEVFESSFAETFVFEDSINGLRAAHASGACVIGLSTTFPAEEVQPYASVVIPDFTAFSYEQMLELKPVGR